MSQQVFKIPLSNVPEKFEVSLAGITYTLISKYNPDDQGGWAIDILDQDENPIACNIPLITGADLLDGLEYLGIPGSLYVNSEGADPLAVPTLDNLGVSSNLYFVTTVANG